MGVSFSQKRSKLTIDSKSLDIETVEKLLLRRDININTIFHRKNSKYKKRTTFLHAAIEEYNDELIDWLIVQKVKPNIKIPKVGQPIDVAIRKQDLDTVRKLVSLDVCLNNRHPKTGGTPLFYASLNIDTKIAEYLIENGANVNINTYKRGIFMGYSPLQIYAENGDIKMTKLMLSKGANINRKSLRGWTPLTCAAHYGHKDVIKLLIDNGANINSVFKKCGESFVLLHAAVFSGSVETLEYLCNLDEVVMDVNILTKKKKNTLLELIEMHSFYSQQIVDFLLDVGLNVNMETKFGALPIELTSRFWRFPKFYSIISKHVLKLISANLPVCPRNKDVVGQMFTDFAAECRQEVAKIKNTKIGSFNITLYDVLHVKEQDLALKLKFHQSEFSEMIRREKMTRRFPLYGGMLAFKLGKVHRRISRLKKTEEVMMEIFDRLRLPYTFLRELFYYLNNCDLKKITGGTI
ncbi:serine/threonine-protein phosphatase 6 regulatory ankyrin repeat subunit B-like [Cotesia glomerata]|uniref:serine/threonine-protein phosphatase 6 regulatory ankyrin repeat subunit B-like n=1 Tax=Cotesia glomerata TaxID=32391 RepID=UPI001D02DF64|nr:serine/threonine-protein phosphatase 6 regulatory ankyrin repeat subunit B-like [Cotesia glomerata]